MGFGLRWDFIETVAAGEKYFCVHTSLTVKKKKNIKGHL